MNNHLNPEKCGRFPLIAMLVHGVVVHCMNVGAADGGLDLAFAADPDYTSMPINFGVIDGQLYYRKLGTPVRRLCEDGSLDAEWSQPLTGLTPPAPVIAVHKTSWGEWLFQGSGLFLSRGSSDLTHLGSAGNYGGPAFPQDDGSVLLANPVGKINSDGELDPRYGKQATFQTVSFESTTSLPKITAIQDRAGRMILGGNFKQVNGFVRMALVRIRADGTADPTWDPGSALGIVLDQAGKISAFPYSLALGPDDSVVVGLKLASAAASPVYHFGVIDADGNVTAIFDSALRSPTAPVVQPDGRIILGGTLGPSDGSPLPAIVRYEADGSVDPTFAVELSVASGSVSIRNLDLDQHGRLWFDGSFDMVNGLPRSELARVFAYDPTPAAPAIQITAHQPRIATNDVLYLTTEVEGFPPPSLQWYLNGVELTGQTNRGVQVTITDPPQVGTYRLVATSNQGVEERLFPPVELATRSPRPGTKDPTIDRPLVPFIAVTSLVPLVDGSVLVGGGDSVQQNVAARTMLGKLKSDLTLDPGFGENGLVSGNGIVEKLYYLPDGAILVAGRFTELGGAARHGLAILDATGQVVAPAFPALDVPHVSSALRLLDGRYVIAGQFTEVDDVPAAGLARLSADLSLDLSFPSPLAPGSFVHDLKVDLQGRLLIASSGPVVGLQRIQENGTPDPGFTPVSGVVGTILLELGGTLLIGSPPRRLASDGQLLVEFELENPLAYAGFPRHRMLQLPNGAIVADRAQLGGPFELIRWHVDGRRDYDFKSRLGSEADGPFVQALALMPDGAMLVATILYGSQGNPPPPAEAAPRLARVPVDADSRLKPTGVAAGEFRVQLETQPDRSYEIRRRVSLDLPASEVVTELDGDGYVRDISTPADQPMLFLELRRQ